MLSVYVACLTSNIKVQNGDRRGPLAGGGWRVPVWGVAQEPGDIVEHTSLEFRKERFDVARWTWSTTWGNKKGENRNERGKGPKEERKGNVRAKGAFSVSPSRLPVLRSRGAANTCRCSGPDV